MPTTVNLRPFQEEDVDFFASMAFDERVTRFVGDGQPWSADTVQTRVRDALQQTPLEQTGASRWFLALEESEAVGIVVSSRRERGVEIGYWVSPEHWGRGVAGAILDHALSIVPEVFGARTLLARVSPSNAASVRLLSRRGFRLESTEDNLHHYRLG